jgi:hypothetical protein
MTSSAVISEGGALDANSLTPLKSLRTLMRGVCDPHKTVFDGNQQDDDDEYNNTLYLRELKSSPQPHPPTTNKTTPATVTMDTTTGSADTIDTITVDSSSKIVSIASSNEVPAPIPPPLLVEQIEVPTIAPPPVETAPSVCDEDTSTSKRVLFPSVEGRTATTEEENKNQSLVETVTLDNSPKEEGQNEDDENKNLAKTSSSSLSENSSSLERQQPPPSSPKLTSSVRRVLIVAAINCVVLNVAIFCLRLYATEGQTTLNNNEPNVTTPTVESYHPMISQNETNIM